MGLPAIAGLRRARWFLKTTAIVVTISFLGLTLQPLALAARLPSAAAPSVKTPPTSEEMLNRTLEGIEDQLVRLETRLDRRADTTTEKARLKTMRQELDALDKQARANFDAIERHLKDKKLPQVILDRHTEAVRTYRSEMAILKSNLDSLEIAKDDTERKARAQKAREHLKAKQKKKAHTPVDPNNLPFRVSDSKKTRKPVKKKEDFRKLGLLQEERIQVAAADLLPGMLTAAAMLALPTPADLQPTEDVQITPEIRALAESLNKNPVKIYNWVHNNIGYIPTYGSVQGSQLTLETRQGNAFDTASLLIALLRASGIPSHYVYGTVQMPIDKVMNWVGGVTVPEAAQELLGQGGIPNTAITQGGKIVAMEFEHVWVEAYVDSSPSRGAINKQGDSWIPMDPSFKQYQRRQAMDLQTIAFDQATIDQLRNALTVNPQDRTLTNINASLIQAGFDGAYENLTNYVTHTNPNISVAEIIGSKEIVTNNRSVLAITLPYQSISVGSRFTTLPDALRTYLSVQLYSDSISKSLGRSDISYRISLPALGYKPFTLSYDLSTSDDLNTLTDNFDLQGGIPTYLIHVKPVLRLDGNIVATGTSLGLAQEEIFNISISTPNASTATQTKIVAAGSYNAIVPQISDVMPKHFQDVISRTSATKSKLESGDFASLSKDDLIGEMLYDAGLGYWAQSELFNQLVASQAKITRNSFQRAGIFSLDLSTQYVFGVPINTKTGPLVSDVRISIETAVASDNDQTKVFSYLISSLTLMSRLEGTIWKQIINSSSAGDGITAASLLAQAGRNSIPIYEIRSDNISTFFPQLTIDPFVKQDISNSISTGKIVYVARDSLTQDGWTGSGYIISDPITGAAAYLISGGLNGGTVVGELVEEFGGQLSLFLSLGGVLADVASALNELNYYLPLLSKLLTIFSFLLSILDLFLQIGKYTNLDCLPGEVLLQFIRGLLVLLLVGVLSSGLPIPLYADVLGGYIQAAFLYEWGGILRLSIAEAYIKGQSCRVLIP
jgi:transglutaminase-like putative cysteine protease